MQKLNLDFREMIATTLYYVASKSHRKIITLDEVINYIRILEKKYNVKFNLVYSKKFNCEKYEKYIIPYVDKDNVYFILKPLCWNLVYTDIVKNHNLLNEKYDEILNNKSHDSLVTIYQNKINENKNINNEKKYISFESLFKLFMFECNRLNINSISKDDFWESISNII